MSELADAVRNNYVLLQHAGVRRTAQMLKLSEEAGEVSKAYINATGMNPRKGVVGTLDDVRGELVDVIVTALVAGVFIGADPDDLMVEAERKAVAWHAAATEKMQS